MNSFKMNGVIWKVISVDPDNPILIDRTGVKTLACTDPVSKRVYISNVLNGELYNKVLLHELCHCALVSYGFLDYIHKVTKPEFWIEAEEFMCNLIADYGYEIQTIADKIKPFIH